MTAGVLYDASTSSMAEAVAQNQDSSSPATHIHTSPEPYERPSEWYRPERDRLLAACVRT